MCATVGRRVLPRASGDHQSAGPLFDTGPAAGAERHDRHRRPDLRSDMERQDVSKQRTRTRVDESGFTLLEMVISIVISTMIIGAMATVFITSADSSNATKHRSNQTNDAQVIASFLVKDAQAAGSMDPQTASNDTTVGVF